MHILLRNLPKVLLVLVLVAPFLFFSSRKHHWQLAATSPIHWVQELLYPVERLIHEVSNTVSSTWGRYIYLVHVAKENEILQKRLFLNEARVLDYDHKVEEVEHLRKLLKFMSNLKQETMVAEVAGVVGHEPFHVIRVTLGAWDGVQVGMPAISDQGIVGRVIRTGIHHADIQRVSDHQFSVDVMVARSRVAGILKGSSDADCHLQLQRLSNIKIGDDIVTAGMTGSFPPGLPVGRVVKISHAVDHVSQEITVRPWVDSRALREVIIIKQINEAISGLGVPQDEEG
jgi:rod shape-determining protein MreC